MRHEHQPPSPRRRARDDLALSGLIALFVSLGIPIGSHLARRLKPIVLRRLVALVLIGTGVSAIIKAML